MYQAMTNYSISAAELIKEYCSPNPKNKSKYQCPQCNGWNLSLNKISGAFSCFNGCNSKEIYKKLHNQWAEENPPLERKKPKGNRFSYEYKRSDGSNGIKVEFIYNWKGEKQIWQSSFGKKWERGYKNCSREEVSLWSWETLQGVDSIHLFEGEQCAKKASEAGIAATTIIGGGSKPPYPLVLEQLDSFKEVVLCPDRDRPGIKWMQEIAQKLEGKVNIKWLFIYPESFSWQRIPLSNGYDIADYLSDGGANIPDEWYFDEPIFDLQASHAFTKKAKEDAMKTLPKNASLSDIKDYLAEIIGDRIRLNLLTNDIEIDGKSCKPKSNRPISFEYILSNSKHLLGQNINIPMDKFRTVMAEICEENCYDPVLNYYESLPTSDYNLNSIASKYFGCESNSIYSEMVRKWLISAVARTYEPGCQADSALILYEAEGGVGKSRWLEHLLPNKDWYAADMGNVSDKDEKLKVHQYKILEWSELDGLFGMRASASIKAFLSCSQDNIRPPYGTRSLKLPRRSIICGTTNKQEVLTDPSGIRRFWIIPVKVRSIPFQLLEKERDLIWGAAVAAYKSGEKWWLENESIQLQQQTARSHLHELEYQSEVELFIADNQPEFFYKEQIEKYLNLSEFECKGFARKLKAIADRIGWDQRVAKVNGKSIRVYKKGQYKDQYKSSTLSTLSTLPNSKSVEASNADI